VFSYHSITDPQKFAAYAKLAPAAVAPFGSRVLARGAAAAAYEQGIKERILIAEFPNLRKPSPPYECPAYKEALKALGDGAVRDFRIVEGLE
jgi:uncharacterized protein (DUF1330 family)